METKFMNTENSKASETHKFIFNWSQRLDARSSKHVALQNLSFYYIGKIEDNSTKTINSK